MAIERIFPSPNPGTAPYWKAARQHQLSLPKCQACGKFHSYPRSQCPFCSSDKLEWTNCSGAGTIFSYTEVFRAPSKAFAADLPYIVAIVELKEGPHLMTRLVTNDNASVRIGQSVTVAFDDMDEETSLPVFKASQT